ncbi:unnamed protein product, partial [Clonostachys rosea f. rosea IK726]
MAANESHSQAGTLGNLRDFDDTVKALEGLVHADCPRGPEWISSAAALVDLYHTKFELTEELRYLSSAISLGEECAMTMTSHQAGLSSGKLDGRQILPRKQFLRSQDAFHCIQKAFQDITRDHPFWNPCLITNSRSQGVYDHTMDVADLEEAIKTSRKLVDSIELGDTNRLAALTNLASLLQD